MKAGAPPERSVAAPGYLRHHEDNPFTGEASLPGYSLRVVQVSSTDG
jgi:hypothetical protein